VIETLLLLEGYGKSVPYQLAIDRRDTKQKQKRHQTKEVPDAVSEISFVWGHLLTIK
jgi:hypothetical protein